MVIQTTRSTTQGAGDSSAKNGSLRSSTRSRKPIRMAPPVDLKTLTMEYDPELEVPKKDRPMGLQDAPTYWPNEKEWADPLGYIQSIADEGKKYGVIKVLSTWQRLRGRMLTLGRLFHQRDGGRNSVWIQR